MRRPRLLDLYCGGGGAAMGYHHAGYDVVGVDIVRQPDYPFEFVQADATRYPLDGFDAVHASPPCKPFTAGMIRGVAQGRLFDPDPDLLTPTLERFADLTVPWVVENVVGAPMPAGSVRYCGSSFGLLIRRHRLFASNVTLTAPPCDHAWQPIIYGIYGDLSANDRRARPDRKRESDILRAGAETARRVMATTWITDMRVLTQAIPPAYTDHIGRQLLGTEP